jgi:hypothetical protein
LQEGIAGGVPFSVIHLLQSVNVDEREHERLEGAMGAIHGMLEDDAAEVALVDASQPVKLGAAELDAGV